VSRDQIAGASGAIPSPNIWHHTATYELENRALDPHGRLWAAMTAVCGGWAGRDVLDLGAGSGFYLPRFAAEPGAARTVTGVEPHSDLCALARRRTRRWANVEVIEGVAQRLPLPPASVDVAHARWSYFFGPGCEPGLRELDRVMRRGGVAMVIDNDGSRSTFGSWFRRGYPRLDPPEVVERFWSTQGWERVAVDMDWSFESRADLEAVVRIEFAPEYAEEFLAEHEGSYVDYAVNLWWKRF